MAKRSIIGDSFSLKVGRFCGRITSPGNKEV
jgi:hypothetical protein